MISANIVAHSTSWLGIPLVSFVLEYPRYIHAELMTHRVFSKNSASSRAIPYPTMLKKIMSKPVIPMWTKNKKGMQGEHIEDYAVTLKAESTWLKALHVVKDYTDALHDLGIHKQNVNRLLEPWMYIRILLTGTDFSNWFELRDHPDAQPEIQELARCMKAALSQSTPEMLSPGQWHMPFAESIDGFPAFIKGIKEKTGEGLKELSDRYRPRIITARCARISYDNVDGSKSSIEKDLELYDQLITSEPLHASPAEHLARVPKMDDLVAQHFDTKWRYTLDDSVKDFRWKEFRGKYVSNLRGWIQFRKIIESGEN